MTALLKHSDTTKTENELCLENARIFEENKKVEKQVQQFSKSVIFIISLFTFAQANLFIDTYGSETAAKFYFLFILLSLATHICLQGFALFFLLKPHNHTVKILSLEEYNRAELTILGFNSLLLALYAYFVYTGISDLFMSVALR